MAILENSSFIIGWKSVLFRNAFEPGHGLAGVWALYLNMSGSWCLFGGRTVGTNFMSSFTICGPLPLDKLNIPRFTFIGDNITCLGHRNDWSAGRRSRKAAASLANNASVSLSLNPFLGPATYRLCHLQSEVSVFLGAKKRMDMKFPQGFSRIVPIWYIIKYLPIYMFHRIDMTTRKMLPWRSPEEHLTSMLPESQSNVCNCNLALGTKETRR